MNKQQGFVQGALLIGIALLAIVIGAFAMASNNNTSDISKEKIKTNAAVVIKKMADAFEQYQITAAQEDLSKADQKISGLNIPMPAGFEVVEYSGVNGVDSAALAIKVADLASCAQINRVLGLASADATDSGAVAGFGAGTNPPEACVSLSSGSTWVYFRNFRGEGFDGSI